jgi:hypothetical protein
LYRQRSDQRSCASVLDNGMPPRFRPLHNKAAQLSLYYARFSALMLKVACGTTPPLFPHIRQARCIYRHFYLGTARVKGEIRGEKRGQAGNGGRLAGPEGFEPPAIACLARIRGSAKSGQDACKRLSAIGSEVPGTARARLCLTGGRMDTSGDAVTKGKVRRAGEGRGVRRDPGPCSARFGGDAGCDR